MNSQNKDMEDFNLEEETLKVKSITRRLTPDPDDAAVADDDEPEE